MSLFERIKINIKDMTSFGPQFLLRHIPRLTGVSVAQVKIPGYGAIHYRVGDSDIQAIRQVFQDEGYKLSDHGPVVARIERRYAEILDEGKVPVIVDAGANIGAASLWFSCEYSLAEVVAVEPDPDSVSILKKNVGEHPKIHVLAAAIGSSQGYVALTKGPDSWSTQSKRAETGISVVTVAEAIHTVKNGYPFIIKIDIEGFENDLFSNNIEWLDDAHVVFIEPHDWKFPGQMTSRTFQRAMGERDFELFICGECLAFVRI